MMPTCPRCGEPGLHGTADECIAALKLAILNWVPMKAAAA